MSGPSHSQDDDAVHGKLLSRGERPPGGWSVTEDGKQGPWAGEWCWRTVHGRSVLRWMFGKPHGASSVGHATGTLPEVEALLSPEGKWRRAAGGGHVHGRLEVSDGALLFIDEPVGAFEPRPLPGSGEPPDLEADLGRDDAFLALVRDEAVAAAVCASLRNRDLVRSDAPDRPWLMSWGRIAGMVAEMRGHGEVYTDWYPYPRETTPAAMASFEAVLARLGWRDLTSDDAARYAGMLQVLMDEVDARPAGPCPEWAAGFGGAGGNEPYDRMATAAVGGRITCEEWGRVIDLHAPVMDALKAG